MNPLPQSHPGYGQLSLDEHTANVITSLVSREGWDTEHVHKAADETLIELLRMLGYTKTADAFDSIEKWYS